MDSPDRFHAKISRRVKFCPVGLLQDSVHRVSTRGLFIRRVNAVIIVAFEKRIVLLVI